jgi:hypothetical protein
MAFGEHLGQLVADTFTADGMNARGENADGGMGSGFDFKSEARGEADGAQEAKLVLLEASAWIANGADCSGIEIG